MENKKIKEIVSGLLPDTLICYDVTNVNHKPHPYMVGSKHVTHASKYYGGMLGEATLKAVKCAYPNCNFSYEEHTSDKVIFLQLKDNVTKELIQTVFDKIIETLPKKSFDGFSFIESKEKYRIL